MMLHMKLARQCTKLFTLRNRFEVSSFSPSQLCFPQRILSRGASNLTHDNSEDINLVKAMSTVDQILSAAQSMTNVELAEIASGVEKFQMKLPIVLSHVPTDIDIDGKFVIYDKGKVSSDQNHKFPFNADTVHSFKLVWSNGAKTDLKFAKQTGYLADGTVMFEVQGLQIGPLIFTLAFPEYHHLADDFCSAADLDGGVKKLVRMCKKHGIVFNNDEHFTDFVDWLMQTIMGGDTLIWYDIVVGALGEAYGNCVPVRGRGRRKKKITRYSVL